MGAWAIECAIPYADRAEVRTDGLAAAIPSGTVSRY